MKAWKGLLEMGTKKSKTSIIRQIFKNNHELYEIVSKQILLLKKYEDDFSDVIPVDEYIGEYQEMLNLLGITSEWGNDEWEWDDETDRKS